MSVTFGTYLREKRKSRYFTIKLFADLIEKSPSYVSQLESNLRTAPKPEMLEKISKTLVLTNLEKKELYDLADKSRKALSVEITEYINSHDIIKETIRVSQSRNIPEKEWTHFLRDLRDKYLF